MRRPYQTTLQAQESPCQRLLRFIGRGVGLGRDGGTADRVGRDRCAAGCDVVVRELGRTTVETGRRAGVGRLTGGEVGRRTEPPFPPRISGIDDFGVRTTVGRMIGGQ